MIKALIFDFAGVIVPDAYWIWIKKHVTDFDSKKPIFQNFSEKADEGLITAKELSSLLAQETGVPEAVVQKGYFQEIRINKPLIDLFNVLKEKYKLAILSNYAGEWLRKILDEHNLMEYFEEIIISSEHHILKPQAKMFQLVLDRLHFTKGQAIFIDDRQGHVDASNVFGLKALLYTSVAKLKMDLEKCGVKS